MPEGHTLHRLARDLTEGFAGQVVRSSSPQGRFAGAALLDGRRLLGAEAWGKHLLVRFSGAEERVHVHLGLWGIVTERPGEPDVVGQVRWRLVGDAVTVDVRGPAACELLTPPEVDALLGRLGPDPLREDADPDVAWQRMSRSRTSIAALLMDQSVVAGVGNVYRAEVLFRLGLDPTTPGRDLDAATWTALWEDLRVLMARGVDGGRIDTVRPEHEPEAMGRPPRVDDHGGEVYVYRRHGQPCLVCGSPVATRELNGRHLYWCSVCQCASRLRG